MAKQATDMLKLAYPYDIKNVMLSEKLRLTDHLNGFDENMHNNVLHSLNLAGTYTVQYHNILPASIAACYPNIRFTFSSIDQNNLNLSSLLAYSQTTKNTVYNLLCCFNGSPHVSRQLLVSALHNFGLFDRSTCSKLFPIEFESIDGAIESIGDNPRILRKFLLSNWSSFDSAASEIIEFNYDRFDHITNVKTLEPIITSSFVNVVSETMATSYLPFVTEKFLYSIVNRNLFLAYAQPNWHSHVEQYYGFKMYSKLFDYSFDAIANPVARLVALVSMISKFQKIKYDDLYDLYLVELDTINYNYDHYYSGDYMKCLSKYDNS